MMTSSNGNIFRVPALCAGNSPVPGEFPAQRPVTRSFAVFFDLYLNKRLSKQWWRWWFETPSRPLWRHCDDQKYSTYQYYIQSFVWCLRLFIEFERSPWYIWHLFLIILIRLYSTLRTRCKMWHDSNGIVHVSIIFIQLSTYTCVCDYDFISIFKNKNAALQLYSRVDESLQKYKIIIIYLKGREFDLKQSCTSFYQSFWSYCIIDEHGQDTVGRDIFHPMATCFYSLRKV